VRRLVRQTEVLIPCAKRIAGVSPIAWFLLASVLEEVHRLLTFFNRLQELLVVCSDYSDQVQLRVSRRQVVGAKRGLIDLDRSPLQGIRLSECTKLVVTHGQRLSRKRAGAVHRVRLVKDADGFLERSGGVAVPLLSHQSEPELLVCSAGGMTGFAEHGTVGIERSPR